MKQLSAALVPSARVLVVATSLGVAACGSSDDGTVGGFTGDGGAAQSAGGRASGGSAGKAAGSGGTAGAPAGHAGESSAGRNVDAAGAGGVGGAGASGASGGGGAVRCAPGSASVCDDGNPCTRDACGAGFCTNTVDDTLEQTQTPGDCKRVLCMGGALASAIDDMDAPDAAADGNVCTIEVCAAGQLKAGGNAPRATACKQASGMPGQCDGAGKCGAPPATGDTCGNPIVVNPAMLPQMLSGTTLDFGPDYGFPSNTCPGEVNGWGGSLGKGSPDAVYSFTPAADGGYTFTLTATGFSETLYLVTGDCGAITPMSCVGAAPVGPGPSVLSASLKAGTTYYVIVDGFSASDSTIGGAYTLGVGRLEKGNCTDMVDNDADGLVDCADPDCASDAACVPVGDQCARPITISALPFTATGNSTQGFYNNYQATSASCPGLGFSVGANYPDIVYAYTPPTTGPIDIAVTGAITPAVYIATDCASIATSCVAGNESGALQNRTLTAGTTYYIIVDGPFDSSGAYTISVKRREAPDCNDGIDNDGNGLIDCADPQCGGVGTCPATPGDICSVGLPITALPFHAAGSTDGLRNDYQYSSGVCPGIFGSGGIAAPDVAYAFTPTVTGSYSVSVDATFDATVIVVSNCATIDASCLAGADAFGGPDTIQSVALTAGTPYFIIVDGYSSGHGTFTIDVTKLP